MAKVYKSFKEYIEDMEKKKNKFKNSPDPIHKKIEEMTKDV